MARVSTTFNLNRKLTAAFQVVITGDNGGSWTTPSFTTNTTLNTVTFDYDALVDVAIFHYETQAHFTEDDVNSEVLDLGGVFATNRYQEVQGCILSSSLMGFRSKRSSIFTFLICASVQYFALTDIPFAQIIHGTLYLVFDGK